ncbi:MAG: aminotransferase class V-fold PLP-dependent enzyme [Hyphomicrobiaceae bacterium]
MTDIDIHSRYRLSRIINASGTMTTIGASMVVPDAIAAGAAIQRHFVSMNQLQSRASEAIASATGAEAGVVTACSAAGMTLGVAAAMTGSDLAAIERLPDTAGLRNEVVIQAGHCINYGAPVEQAIRIAGAKVVQAGSAALVETYNIEAAITPATAAILHVVSHHTVQEGQTPLADVIAIGKAQGIPVIVDMASEYDLRGPIALGAALAIYSAHKFLGGPTAGIIAGSRELVRACYLQNRGIGRTMKVGKEGVLGTIAALEAWSRRDHAALRAKEDAIVAYWERALANFPGISLSRHADWTGNPVERLKLTVGRGAGLYAWELADRLAACDPAVFVRDDLVEQGAIYLDPCNLRPGEEKTVADAIRATVEAARQNGEGLCESLSDRRKRAIAALQDWPA